MSDTSIVSSTRPDPADYLPHLYEAEPVLAEAGECSFELVVALAAKGFVILTGQSGTGKSRSAIELGQGLDLLEQYGTGVHGSSYEMVAVGADWTDSRPLLGYQNPFGAPRDVDGETTHVTYEIPDSLRLVLRAASPSSASLPCILILDEMNLSHVERYFSPFLSLIEANRSSAADAMIPILPLDKLTLISEVLEAAEPNNPETTAAAELVTEGRGLQIPQNLMIVGTVNVDETTYMFSPKVLDRAHVIELHSVPPTKYFDKQHQQGTSISVQKAYEFLGWAIEHRKDRTFDQHPTDVFTTAKQIAPRHDADIDALAAATKKLLSGAYKLLDPIGFAFGFRTINEVCGYLLCWIKGRTLVVAAGENPLDGWQAALDTVFLQKVLPKLHGNRRQFGDSLAALEAFLAGEDENAKPPAKYRLGAAEPVGITAAEAFKIGQNQMARSRAKLNSMQVQLQAVGYTTFIR